MYPNIDGFHVKKAYEGAKQLLEKVGIHVINKRLLEKAKESLLVHNNRVFFSANIVEEYVNKKIRNKGGNVADFSENPGPILFNSGVNCRYMDVETGRVHPFDTPSLIEHTKFIRQLAAESRFLYGVTPGYAMDIHPELQFLNSYYVDILYNPSPTCFSLTASVRSMKYQIEMAHIVGSRQHFCVEPISPMRFVGDSVNSAVELYEAGMTVGVDPMPTIGVTAPMDWHAAWAQSMAENIGSCILLELLGIDSSPTFRLFVPNMSNGMTYFSSPSHLKNLLLRRKVKAFFGYEEHIGELLLVTAKQPDQQAAAEKMAGCVAGAIHGFNYLEGAGNLDIDNIFSARQLMIDLEIRGFVRNMLTELKISEVDIVREVMQGVAEGSFLETDLSLENWREYTWQPKLFDIGGKMADSILERAGRVSFHEIAARYKYELSGEKREQVERLMYRAKKEFADY